MRAATGGVGAGVAGDVAALAAARWRRFGRDGRKDAERGGRDDWRAERRVSSADSFAREDEREVPAARGRFTAPLGIFKGWCG